MVDLALLGLLRESQLHGYELKKRLPEVLGHRSGLSFGSLYPALGRLEAEGAVQAVASGPAPAPAMPMTGSFSGEAAAFRATRRRAVRGPRNRKVFGITAAGEARLAELVADPTVDDRTFRLKLAFCRWCDSATRLRLFERRRASLVERAAETRTTLDGRRPRNDRYLRSLLEHEAEGIEREITWLDGLIADERVPTT